MANEGWHVLDDDGHVLWRQYMFRKGAWATTLVFRGKGDELVVVSPHTRPSASELDALKEHGRVSALVANNKWHHLGQAAWRKHFPEAKSYAPTAAAEKLLKKAPDIPFRPLSELSLGEGARCESPAGMPGETFLSIPTKKGAGAVWYAGDLLTNIPSLPPPPVSWLFKWTDSAPGFRLFKPAIWTLVKDKKTLRSWMLDRLASEPPSSVVPAHGPAFDATDIVEQTRTQLERL